MHKGFKNFQSQILQASLVNRHVIDELKKFLALFIIFIVNYLKYPMMNFTDFIN